VQVAQMVVNITNVAITAIISFVGLYLVHNIRRQNALRVAEKRLVAYTALWDKMSCASPVRLTEWYAEPLTPEQRIKLFQAFTTWYYENGNGMFLGASTRTIYLRVKDNLVCPIECYEPASTRAKLQKMFREEQEAARGFLAIRQLSLLRNRMRADLEVYGLPYHVDLIQEDREFLKFCGEKLSSKPWASHVRPNKPTCRNVPIFPMEDVV